MFEDTDQKQREFGNPREINTDKTRVRRIGGHDLSLLFKLWHLDHSTLDAHALVLSIMFSLGKYNDLADKVANTHQPNLPNLLNKELKRFETDLVIMLKDMGLLPTPEEQQHTHGLKSDNETSISRVHCRTCSRESRY